MKPLDGQIQPTCLLLTRPQRCAINVMQKSIFVISIKSRTSVDVFPSTTCCAKIFSNDQLPNVRDGICSWASCIEQDILIRLSEKIAIGSNQLILSDEERARHSPWAIFSSTENMTKRIARKRLHFSFIGIYVVFCSWQVRDIIPRVRQLAFSQRSLDECIELTRWLLLVEVTLVGFNGEWMHKYPSGQPNGWHKDSTGSCWSSGESKLTCRSMFPCGSKATNLFPIGDKIKWIFCLSIHYRRTVRSNHRHVFPLLAEKNRRKIMTRDYI